MGEHEVPGGPGAETAVDWFGFPIGADGRSLPEPVPCPHCRAPFGRRDDLAVHLRDDHDVEVRRGRPPVRTHRARELLRSLRFLPLWFVLPLNAALTTVLLLAWGSELTLFSLDDQLPVLKTWIVRLSVLPSILLLSWRVVDRRV